MTKHVLFCSLLLTALTAHTEETFTPQQMSLTYTIQPKDHNNREDFDAIIAQIRHTHKAFHRAQDCRTSTSDLYQQALNLIASIQQIISSSLGLISTVNTSQEPVVLVAEQVAAQAVVTNEPAVDVEADAVVDTAFTAAAGADANPVTDAIVNDVVNAAINTVVDNVIADTATVGVATSNVTTTSTTATTDATTTATSDTDASITDASTTDASTVSKYVEEIVVNDDSLASDVVYSYEDSSITTVTISISCMINNLDDVENWTMATTMLQELADAINNQSLSPDDVVAIINDVCQLLPSNITVGFETNN